MPEYAQIDLFVYKAKIFRNRFVTIGWFNQINYMRGRRQDRILFLIGSSPAGGLFLFLPAELSNIKKQFESLTCIKEAMSRFEDGSSSRSKKQKSEALCLGLCLQSELILKRIGFFYFSFTYLQIVIAIFVIQ